MYIGSVYILVYYDVLLNTSISFDKHKFKFQIQNRNF